MCDRSVKKIKLNCDLGESFGQWQMGRDADVMPLIDEANIACGFHAGDPVVMQQTVALAVKHQVSIGAHPSYPDLQGFGRRSMKMAASELIAQLHYQLGALQGICQVNGTQLEFVKPHGALYNDMMRDLALFETLCQALSQFDANLVLVIQALPNTQDWQQIAQQYDLNLRFEAFADRNYQDNGLLVPRTQGNAVLSDPQTIFARVTQLAQTGKLTSVTGKPLSLQVDTICVHSDTDNALAIAKKLASIH
ncbi:5-oxoprolinase subunit PxpA [Thalassotalea euphylliae]|uniref:5-oxoprolinase subunit PxpA n=2 Tax=Thalassotalea euphylliae TaxID=1655234 RepID=A0A3E0TLN3_9GAMM|nr:5-oxoprolinase subunit PxpA [Thalassotalea euphylliae]